MLMPREHEIKKSTLGWKHQGFFLHLVALVQNLTRGHSRSRGRSLARSHLEDSVRYGIIVSSVDVPKNTFHRGGITVTRTFRLSSNSIRLHVRASESHG